MCAAIAGGFGGVVGLIWSEQGELFFALFAST